MKHRPNHKHEDATGRRRRNQIRRELDDRETERNLREWMTETDTEPTTESEPKQ